MTTEMPPIVLRPLGVIGTATVVIGTPPITKKAYPSSIVALRGW
jgi:hypothetical protein